MSDESKCQCKRQPDSAFTVQKLPDGRFKCPRCGGIIEFKEEKLASKD